MELQHIPGKNNVADIWTKALGRSKFIHFRSQLGINPPVATVSEN